MILAEGKNSVCWVIDIETLREMFYIGCYNGETGEQKSFEISRRKNQLLDFVKWYQGDMFHYSITFNGVAFDCPVLEFVMRNHKGWYDKTGEELVEIIKNFANKVIDDKNHGITTYYENSFSKPTIDVFTILGLDNAARSASLKHLEFCLQMPQLQTMPIHHEQTGLTDKDMDMVAAYCGVDLAATWVVFELILGKTEHALYKGNNQLQLRFDIIEEFGLDCLNFSDIKIGDELMKKSYADTKGIKIKDIPRKGTFRKEIKLSRCIPDFVTFETPQLKKIHAEVKKRAIAQMGEFGYEFDFYGTKYSLLKGGMHSVNSCEMYDNKLFDIWTSDVGSFYPASIVERLLYPYHLGVELINVYAKKYHERIRLKPESKKNKKIKGICDAIKLQLNVVFGKMGSMDSWLFDMQTLLSVTIGNEFTLLMLIEKLELAGMHVIVANTDGIEVLVPKGRGDEYLAICKWWEDITKYVLEHDEYEFLYMWTVNDYIARTIDRKDKEGKLIEGKYKYKGDALTDHELYKNPSMRVIPLAIQEFVKNGTDPVSFIKNHKNIYDFCIRSKASGKFHLEEQTYIKPRKIFSKDKDLEANGWERYGNELWIKSDWKESDQSSEVDEYDEDGDKVEKISVGSMAMPLESALDLLNLENMPDYKEEIIKHDKLVRYYISNNGKLLFKRGFNKNEKAFSGYVNAPMKELNNKPVLITNFNDFVEKEDYDINYPFYIIRTFKMLDKLYKKKKTRYVKNYVTSLMEELYNVKQTSLF